MGLRQAGLDTYERDRRQLRIGATLPSPRLPSRTRSRCCARPRARTASWSIRNMATVGGNLFTPPPGGDVAMALLALDARCHHQRPQGRAELAAVDLWTGFMTTALAADELLTAITVPLRDERDGVREVRPEGGQHAGHRHCRRPLVARRGRDRRRIALGAAGPHPIRAIAAEAALAGTTLDAGAIAARGGRGRRRVPAPRRRARERVVSPAHGRIFVERALRAAARPSPGRP